MAQKTTCGITYKLFRATGDAVPNHSLQGARHAYLWLAALGAIVLARP